MKGIIFDLDGVIIHTDHYHFLAWKKMCERYDLDFNETINHKLRGVSRKQSLDIILDHNDKLISDGQKKEMTDIKNDIYQSYLSKLSIDDLDDDVKDTLDQLKKSGYKLAIGSSSKNAKYILRQIGLIDFFQIISDGTNISKSKPHPEVFLNASIGLNLEPKDCIVIEDAVSGIKAAKAAQMIAVAIGDAKQSELADYKINNVLEIIKIMEKLEKA